MGVREYHTIMEPFVTFRDTDSDGKLQYYVLQRKYPNFVGVIMDQPQEDSLACVPISGHHLYMVFGGTIQGMYIPLNKGMLAEITEVFLQMAQWYASHRIMENPERYKKFKI